MSGITDFYDQRYQQTLTLAPWYKQPAARTAIKVVATVTIVALSILAAISARSLAAPASSIGTTGAQVFGQSGLIACTTLGFASSAIFSILLIHFLRKTIFFVSDYIQDTQGFLYAIKDKENQIKAYLYGTIHKAPARCILHPQVSANLSECEKVFVECYDPKFREALLAKSTAIDSKVAQLAEEKEIPIEGFETLDEQMGYFLGFVIESFSGNHSSQTRKRSGTERLDRMTVAWQLSDENLLMDAIGDHSSLDNIAYARNVNWMPKISSALATSTKPLFIAVGSAHLFNPAHSQQGLLGLFAQKGYHVEKISLNETTSTTYLN